MNSPPKFLETGERVRQGARARVVTQSVIRQAAQPQGDQKVTSYEFAREELKPWLGKEDVAAQIDPRSVEKGLCDILSLQKPPEVAEEERDIFHRLYCIMTGENRNWLSISQVAYPHAQLTGESPPPEADLKSRIGLAARTGGEQVRSETSVPMQYRRRFLDLVSLCIPIEERKQYPHILALIDSHAFNTPRPPANESSGVDCAAWCLANYFFTEMRWQSGPAALAHPMTLDMSTDEIKVSYEKRLAQVKDAIDDHPWVRVIADAPASNDSLFSRLLVNAAINRHCLETWAYEKRLFAHLEMQQQVFSEVSSAAPNGLGAALRQASADGAVDYMALVKHVLERTLADKGKPLTERVRQRISEQADAVIASARDENFWDESALNEILVKHPVRAKALLWIILTWCHQHGYRISNEDSRVHRTENTVISTRSKLITESQDMATLRRMLSTPIFSRQWDKPDPVRLEFYVRENSAIRTLARSSLERTFKGASLAQLDAFVSRLPRDRYIELVKHAEVHRGGTEKSYF
ncbi:hypothetical protein QO025_24540 [Burkholderia pseudomallei]|uniref:hypothetical protein n=1 Tax=Burkholderia pseudomallei TaxID=28450 RepID=UPI0021F7785F|nr:hypothetical protein [Burkholderia pseudomallei]MCW0090580.1 hypothetical protein [Burkholderia pseudomallei]MCW0122557.1 hypothetical protein [Burkholderia pseudomallei]MDK2576099.1 hypothetical protein [Burkholderia pseudomallei]